MRKQVIKALNWLIWVIEGRALGYYRKQLEIFLAFGLPRIVHNFRRRHGLVREYSFNVIDVCVTYDEEKILNSAIDQNNRKRFVRNQKKAQLSVERYARENKGSGLNDIEGMETITGEVKLNREERANAGKLYDRLSFKKSRG